MGLLVFAAIPLVALGCLLGGSPPPIETGLGSQVTVSSEVAPPHPLEKTPTLIPELLTSTSLSWTPSPQGWKGLGFDPDEWTAQEVLVFRGLDTCVIRFRVGGRDLPENFTIERERKRLELHEFDVSSIYSGDHLLYVNYSYVFPEPGPKGVGFQVSSSENIAVCIEKAEALFSTLDPSALMIPTSTPAG